MIPLWARLTAGVCLLVLAFGTGYYTKGRFVKADLADRQAQAVKDAGANIVHSVEQSQQVEATLRQSDNRIDQLRKAAADRLQKGKVHDAPGKHAESAGMDGTAAATQPLVEVPEHADGCDGSDILDFGTVRLLNRARALESAGGSTR